MEKAKTLPFIFRKASPLLTRGLEQLECSFDICTDKILRVVNRPVHVTFSRKVDDCYGLMEQQQPAHKRRIIDVSAREHVAIIAGKVGQVARVSRIRELIQVHNPRTFCREPMQYEVG